MLKPVQTRNRIGSVDLLRGVVMVIMALDHVRDFFHNDADIHEPTDPRTTTPILFFTRFITHFCAPVFIMLAGLSAFLYGMKTTKKELSVFLIKRGIWLVLIEFLLVTLAIRFDPLYHVLILQVIWTIGICMIILGIVIWLPIQVIFLLGLCIVLGHNLFDAGEVGMPPKMNFWRDLLHHGFFVFYPIYHRWGILMVYPFVAWAGIMMLGYCMGTLYKPSADALRRKKTLLYLGLGMISSFIVLRLLNGYGDPVPWTQQRNSVATFLSFMNVRKYPPSLMYICITIGPALIFLSLTERVNNKLSDFFKVYGNVPLFFYVIHFFLIHALSVVLFYVQGFGAKDIVNNLYFRPKTLGIDLWGVYIVWVLVVAIMYPLCKWFGRYKNEHRQWWIRYV
jgi:uncharacterized membrane protein